MRYTSTEPSTYARDASNMNQPELTPPGFAADLLWKHQLRQENAALDKKIAALGGLSKELLDHQNNLTDMSIAFNKLETEFVRENKEHTREVEEFQKRLSALEKKAWPNASEQDIIAMIQQRERRKAEERTRREVDMENQEHQDPIMAATNAQVNRPVNLLTSRSAGRNHPDSSDSLAKEILKPLRRPSSRQATATINRPTTRQPSREKSAVDTLIDTKQPTSVKPANFRKPVAKKSSSEKIPKIMTFSQKRETLDAYLKRAAKIRAELGDIDEPAEIKFVNTWIRGITSTNVTSDVMIALKRRNRSRTNAEGQNEILCEWIDVEPALVEAELVGKTISRKRKA